MAEEFSLSALRDYMVKHGGRATNHELVKHFKKFLTDPDLKDEARAQFRDFINTLAVVKQEGDEKILVLRKNYSPDPDFSFSSTTSLNSLRSNESQESSTPPRYRVPPSPYRPQEPFDTPIEQNSTLKNVPSSRNPIYLPDDYLALALGPPGSSDVPDVFEKGSEVQSAPFLPPRKKQVTKTSAKESQNKENELRVMSTDKPEEQTAKVPIVAEEAVPLSVKERTQKFNRLASQSALLPGGIRGSTTAAYRREKSSRNAGGDDDDTSSLATMDPRAREWLLASAQGDYNPIAKLLQEEPRLAKRKDYITGYTGLHWAAKHGEMDLIKLLAGSYCVDVHAKSHGGYTALHLAAQQGHNDVYDLLVKAYQANENIRDYSGKKPRQYFPVKESSMSSDVYKKINAKRSLQEEKETGFLRIGSINVRVKKTTEKFNSLLGGDRHVHHFGSERKQKTWGSSDNIQSSLDRQLMPPPKGTKKKRPKEWPAAEKPTIQIVNSPTLTQMPPIHSESEETDSDSAYGFGSDWHP